MAGPGEAPRPVVLPGRWGGLRPLDPERDAAGLYAVTHSAGRDALWEHMKVGPFADAAAFTAHLADCADDPGRAFYAVVDPAGTPLGWLCLMEVQPAHRSVELGYVTFGPPLQRTVLATEAFHLIMKHVFETLGMARLEWTCTAGNVRSQRAAERLGFTREGVMRSKLVLKGQTHDIPLYSMLADEWPGVRAALENWLDPANFDQGLQRQPLRMR